MRSAKVPASTAAVAAPECEVLESSKALRLRKASRAPSQSLSSVSSSAHSSDVEGPASPGRASRPESTQQRHAVVIDHQGAGKVMHKPDGTVVWEPAPEPSGPDARRPRPGPLVRFGETLGMALSVGSVVLGGAVTLHKMADPNAPALTPRDLSFDVAKGVTGFIAGTVTGLALGPVLAAVTVTRALARPALVAWVAHRGVKALASWRIGVAGLLRKLQSTDPAKVLEALRAIIAAAARGSPRFAREFNRLKGMEVLLQKLAAALPDCPILHLIAQALAELCKDQECRDSLVAAGGVPRLVALLHNPNPVVAGQGLAALATLTDHTLGVEAIRESGGLTRLVELTAISVALPQAAGSTNGGPAAAGMPYVAVPSASSVADRRAALTPCVKLLQALSLDPAGKAAIGAAGGVSVLLDVIARSAPRSDAQCEAVAALHNCLRGSPDNQRTLAALPAASEVLRGALAGLGPCWHPCKGDLHALLNVLARLQGVQEAGGFVVIQSQAAAAAREGAGGAAAAAPASKA